jgi:hypothetical protein
MNENQIGSIIVNCAVQLHREIGPGLLEPVYEAVLARRLSRQGLKIARQVPVKILIDGEEFEEGFRADLIIEGKVIIELKSIESAAPRAQKATPDLPETNRAQTLLHPQLRRRTHEKWDHPLHQWQT